MLDNVMNIPILQGKNNTKTKNKVEYQNKGMRFAHEARDEVET